VRANDISVWYQFPQYIIITAGEVLFSVTGLSFAYTQVTLDDVQCKVCVCCHLIDSPRLAAVVYLLFLSSIIVALQVTIYCVPNIIQIGQSL